MEPEQSKSNESIEINKYFILRALAVRGQIESMMGAMLTAVIVLFFVWVTLFLVVEDNAWYNWLEFIQVFMILGYLLLAMQTDNVERNLKYMLVVSALVFLVDLIVVAFVRPVGYDNVNPLNECKRRDKLMLIILQATFTALDFIALIAVIYFAYGSDLQKPEVLFRYQSIGAARVKYLTKAIEEAIIAEMEEVKASLALNVQKRKADEELRLRMYQGMAAAPSSTPPTTALPTAPPPAPLPASTPPPSSSSSASSPASLESLLEAPESTTGTGAPYTRMLHRQMARQATSRY